MRKAAEVTITLGDGVAVVKTRGRSSPVIAGILGTDGPAEAPSAIYLDRRIHRPGERQMGEYTVGGARTSVLYPVAE